MRGRSNHSLSRSNSASPRFMSTILLADDSPHAQRMGQHILEEEGFQVTVAGDGDSALASIASADPDLVIADAYLPGRNGVELCRLVKNYRPHTRVVLTAGSLEDFDENEARRSGCDGVLRKPFEASVAASLIHPLIAEARKARGNLDGASPRPIPVSDAPAGGPALPPLDPKVVEAAVGKALEQALPQLIRDITKKVLVALGH